MRVSVVFFFTSKRRNTRYRRDWSSDVCSSDLFAVARLRSSPATLARRSARHAREKPSYDRVKGGEGTKAPGGHASRARPREIGRAPCRGKSVDLGGRRIIKKKTIVYDCITLFS